MDLIHFNSWNELTNYCQETTGFKPYSGVGICPRQNKTTILRSVDGTIYYDDNLSDINNVEYTLFGHNGDQSLDEKRFNKPLIESENIYLYRVLYNKNKPTYLWYGKYKNIGNFEKQHQGKDGNQRKIIIIKLKRQEWF